MIVTANITQLTAIIFTGIIFSVAALSPARSESIDIVGTGDGVIILKSIAKAFEQKIPGDSFNVPESIGSSGGIKAVGNDKNQIGRVARKIKDKEKPFGLTYFPIAKFPVVFFVNKSVTVTNATSQQINDIYSGKITNWNALGGGDGKIRVVRREDGDSSLKNLIKNFPGFKDVTITKHSKTATMTQENFDIVSSKTGTIGFGPYADALRANVSILMIDNKNPTDSDYPNFSVLALIFKEDNRKGIVNAILDFAVSKEGKKAIEDANAVPYE